MEPPTAPQPGEPNPGQTLLNLPAAGSPVPAGAEHAGAAPPAGPVPLQAQPEPPGPRIGRYRVIREHARGGMGRVLLAVDTTIGRNVAVKELLSGLAAESSASAATRSIGERFLREARVTGRLEHPNIVPVYEIGTNEAGAFFYSMRFVGGRTMAQRLQDIAAASGSERDRMAARLGLLEAFQDVCNAVAYAHSRGVIHRDLKPANVMLGEFGETVVLDWGLARLHGEAEAPARGTAEPAQGDSAQLTLDGAVVGTPAYMPPEQARGEQHLVDERSDVYSLGAMLYEVLTGRPPFEGSGAHAVLRRVVSEAPRPVLELAPGVPRELAVLCARAMERDRDRRLGSALALATEVKAFRDGKALASYEYTSLELLTRFLRRQWRMVAVVGLALAAVASIGAVAVREVVRERNAARDALDAAEAAEARRVEAAELAARRERDLQDSRREAIRRAQDALAGFQAEPLLRDLVARVEGYRREQRTLGSLNAPERERNRALITAVLGYAAQLQELLRLQGAEAAQADAAGLARVQAALVELAIFDSDFELADYLLSGSGLPEDQLAELALRNREQREAMLAWRKQRIEEALLDARLGLRREGRPPHAPTLAQYVATLAAFQDAQTVDLLGAELQRLQAQVAATPAPTVLEFDRAALLCGALGRLQQPSRAVPLLAAFLRAQKHPRTATAALEGLAATQDRAGTLAAVADANARSLRFVEQRRDLYAAAFLPPGLAQDNAPAAGFLLWARREHEPALRALEHAGGEPLAALVRGLALAELGRRDEARQVLAELAAARPGDLGARIALARVQDDAEAQAGLDAAVAGQPPQPEALLARAAYYRERNLALAVKDAQAAIALQPGDAELLQFLGDLLRDSGELHESLEAYEQAIAADPDNALAWIFKAEVLRSLERPFLPAALRAVELAPGNSHAWAYLCQAYYFRMELPLAIEAGRRAVALSEYEQEGWYYLGLSCLRMRVGGERRAEFLGARAGEPTERAYLEQAVQAFRGHLRVNPQDFRSTALLGDCLLALGDLAGAREALQRASGIAFLEAQTTGMGMSGVRRSLAVLAAKEAQVQQPGTVDQLLDAALAAAFDATQEAGPEGLLQRTREALRLLHAAEDLLAGPRSRPVQARLRQVRAEIAEALRQGGCYHAIPSVLLPAVQGEPTWVVVGLELSIGEALAAAGLQWREGRVQLFAPDDEGLKRMQDELDALTGTGRKARGEAMIDEGLQRLRALADQGFTHPDLDGPSPLGALAQDPRWLAVQTAFRSARARAQGKHPYGVMVVTGIRPGTQAARLGLRQRDVLAEVEGRPVRTLGELREAVAAMAGRESYELVVRRYRLDAQGQLVLKRDGAGNVQVDERGNPLPECEEVRFRAAPGMLGVNLEPGYLPHPLD